MDKFDCERFNICSAANVCAVTAGDNAPECGTVREHVSPIPLSEKACLRALSGAHKVLTESAQAFPRTEVECHQVLAWSELDLGMAAETEDVADAHFGAAGEHVGRVLEARNTTFDLKMKAALLHAYLPAFRARRVDPTPTEHTIADVRGGLAVIQVALQQAPIHSNERDGSHFGSEDHQPCLSDEGFRLGLKAELTVLQLAARGGVLLYPSSTRESEKQYPYRYGDDAHMCSDLVHDMYGVVTDKSVKIPLKLQADKRDDQGAGRVERLYYLPMIKNALNALKTSPRPEDEQLYLAIRNRHTNGELVAQIPVWLTREAAGEHVSPYQIDFMNTLTSSIKHTLAEYESE